MNTIVAGLLERGVPTLLVSFGGTFFTVMISYRFMCKLLPNRLNIYKLIAASLVYTLWYNLRMPALFGTGYHLGMNIFINLWTFFVVLFLFQGKLWRRVMVYFYFDIIKTMCEAISYVPVMLYRDNNGFRGEWSSVVSSVESNAMLRLLYIFTFIPLFLVLGYLSLKIWRKLLLQRFQPFYLLFIVLPMGQMYALSLVIHPNMGDILFSIAVSLTTDVETIYHVLALYGIVLCLAVDLVLLGFVVSHEKKAALEQNLSEARRQMELEQTHYRELEQRHEELSKIRHDFNNQLASISRLARSGETGAAQELLDAVSHEINAH